MNTLAPSKWELITESPEGNPAQQYAYRAFCDNAYWTAIYMAYRLSRINPMGGGIAAWDFYDKETDNYFRKER